MKGKLFGEALRTAVTINRSVWGISIFMSIILFGAVIHMKDQNKRMGWFLMALSMTAGGLASEFAVENDFTGLLSGGTGTIRANIFYSLFAPLFVSYFIDTEKEEGQEWDSRFWAYLQIMIAVLVSLLSVFQVRETWIWIVFLLQYLLLVAMLLASPKDFRACMWFVTGALFPVAAALAGMVFWELRLLGFGLVMMLLVILFGYQADVEKELLRKRSELAESRVALLAEQIHPHFIYNSLQQIALLCGKDAGEAQDAIYRFSRYLRSNFESLTDEGMIPFEKEMEHVDMFLQTVGLAMSKSFEVEKELTVTDFMLPALSLQPLVENAVQYGIGMSTEGGRILIRTEKEGGYFLIRVRDDGHGKKTRLASQEKHKSIGTKNVQMRLSLLCRGGLEIKPLDRGTEAVIWIPVGSQESGNPLF